MKLKYELDLRAIEECPEPSCKPIDRISWRFVHAERDHPNNFLPAAKIKPGRKFPNSKACCSALALSMFVSRQKARDHYIELVGRFPNIHKTIGTHIASGRLERAEGLATDEEGNGHFDFFEFEGLNLASKFVCAGEASDAAD